MDRDPPTALQTWIRQLVHDELALAIASTQISSEYLTTAEAGSLARVAPGTVRRWIRQGRLPCTSAGREVRVRRADLERMMRRDSPGTKPREPSPEAQAARMFGLGRE